MYNVQYLPQQKINYAPSQGAFIVLYLFFNMLEILRSLLSDKQINSFYATQQINLFKCSFTYNFFLISGLHLYDPVPLEKCNVEKTRNGLLKITYRNESFVQHGKATFRCPKHYLGCKKRAVIRGQSLLMRHCNHEHEKRW